MKPFFLGCLAISLFTAFAPAYGDNENALHQLLNAVTVCPTEQNPKSVLTELHGNSFGDVRYENESSTTVLADAVANPQLYNPLIMAPAKIMGTIRVDMTYPAPGRGLICTVTYK